MHVGYDIQTDQAEGELLFFSFELPELVSSNDVRAFSVWLASTDRAGETLH